VIYVVVVSMDSLERAFLTGQEAQDWIDGPEGPRTTDSVEIVAVPIGRAE